MADIQSALRAHTDQHDRLIQADDRLALANARCGGGEGQELAIQSLLDLVVKSRALGLSLSRPVQFREGDKIVFAWAELKPMDGGEIGCEISLSQWEESSLTIDKQDQLDSTRFIYERVAQLVLTADESGRVCAVEASMEALKDAFQVSDWSDAHAASWTESCQWIDHLPADWRDLRGSACSIAGVPGTWSVNVEADTSRNATSCNYRVYFISGQSSEMNDPASHFDTPSLGRDLTPALRQPINRIIANAETVRTRLAGPLSEEYSAYAADIANAGQHLLALIDDLADLEVVEAADFRTAPDLIDLADVARRACGILGVRAAERSITLEAPREGEHQWAVAEFRRVLQVLLNLVGNAIRYAPEDSQVWVRIDHEDGQARVTVADQGQGLDGEQQDRVFEKFERLGRSGDGGSGLGLYISRRIAHAMNGDLTVDSAPGQGARFTLSVPAAKEQVDAEA